jgi:hypothetical protein
MHSHHHRIPAPPPKPQGKHHYYGSGHLTGFVITVLIVCFAIAIAQSFTGGNYP